MKHLWLLSLVALNFACTAEITNPEQTDTGLPDVQVDATAGLADGGDLPDLVDAGFISPDSGVDASADFTEGPTQVPLFIAQGDLGRIMVSCDGGASWEFDQDDLSGRQCYVEASGSYDCNHGEGAARGLAWGDGVFLATFGWGEPGGVRRSTNGVDWTEVIPGTTYGGVAYGNGVFLAGKPTPKRSTDGGLTWEDSAASGMSVYNVRGIGFADYETGRFIMVGEDASVDIVISSDGAQTWWKPTTLPAGCGSGIQFEGGIAYGNRVIVIVGSGGNGCRSIDGGQNWQTADLDEGIGSDLLFDGENFRIFGNSAVFSSPDGINWSKATIPIQSVGAAAISDDGQIAAARGGWQNWYARQEFYHAPNAATWDVILAPNVPAGHPIQHMKFGWGTPSATCPAK